LRKLLLRAVLHRLHNQPTTLVLLNVAANLPCHFDTRHHH